MIDSISICIQLYSSSLPAGAEEQQQVAPRLISRTESKFGQSKIIRLSRSPFFIIRLNILDMADVAESSSQALEKYLAAQLVDLKLDVPSDDVEYMARLVEEDGLEVDEKVEGVKGMLEGVVEGVRRFTLTKLTPTGTGSRT